MAGLFSWANQMLDSLDDATTAEVQGVSATQQQEAAAPSLVTPVPAHLDVNERNFHYGQDTSIKQATEQQAMPSSSSSSSSSSSRRESPFPKKSEKRPSSRPASSIPPRRNQISTEDLMTILKNTSKSSSSSSSSASLDVVVGPSTVTRSNSTPMHINRMKPQAATNREKKPQDGEENKNKASSSMQQGQVETDKNLMLPVNTSSPTVELTGHLVPSKGTPQDLGKEERKQEEEEEEEERKKKELEKKELERQQQRQQAIAAAEEAEREKNLLKQQELQIQEARRKAAISAQHNSRNNHNNTNNNNNNNNEQLKLEQELSQAKSEIVELRKVWNQERDKLSRYKQVIRSKEDSIKRLMQEKEEITASEDSRFKKLVETRLERLRVEHEREIIKLKRTLAQNQTEFEGALSARNAYQQSVEEEIKEAHKTIDRLRSECEALDNRYQEIEQERTELVKLQNEQIEAHQEMLKQLREEQTKREEGLAQEKQIHTQTMETIKNRESTLEADNVEYVNALAAAHRAIEDKSSQLQRVLAEKRWIEADHQALQDQLAAIKSRMEADAKRAAVQIETCQESVKQLQGKNQSLSGQVQSLQQSLMTEQLAVQEVKSKLQASEANPSRLRVKELENRLKDMADHLMSKAATIERLASERSTLKIQLENESSRLRACEARLQEAAARQYFHDDPDGLLSLEEGAIGAAAASPSKRKDGSIANRWRRNDRYANGFNSDPMVEKVKEKAPAVAKAVGLLDSMANYFGFLLRKHFYVRVFFAFYVVLIHLWIAFVCYHFLHHADMLAEATAAGVGGAGAAGAAAMGRDGLLSSRPTLPPGMSVSLPTNGVLVGAAAG